MMGRKWGYVKPHLKKMGVFWEAFKRSGDGNIAVKSGRYQCPRMAMIDLRARASAQSVALWDDIFWLEPIPV